MWWLLEQLTRWSSTIARGTRLLIVLVLSAAAVGFFALFWTTASDDYQLARYGIPVLATVEDSAPYDRDPQYLLRFEIDGQQDEQWAIDLGSRQPGSTVYVVVDRRDHGRIKLAGSRRDQIIGYALAVGGSIGFAVLGIWFARMSDDEYRRLLRSRYGGRPV